MIPGADLLQERDGGGSQAADAVGVVLRIEGPRAGFVQVLSFDQGDFQLGGGGRSP